MASDEDSLVCRGDQPESDAADVLATVPPKCARTALPTMAQGSSKNDTRFFAPQRKIFGSQRCLAGQAQARQGEDTNRPVGGEKQQRLRASRL